MKPILSSGIAIVLVSSARALDDAASQSPPLQSLRTPDPPEPTQPLELRDLVKRAPNATVTLFVAPDNVCGYYGGNTGNVIRTTRQAIRALHDNSRRKRARLTYAQQTGKSRAAPTTAASLPRRLELRAYMIFAAATF